METAKWICVGAIDITQLSVAGMDTFFSPLFLPSKLTIKLSVV
jgi:hypothetical protein